MKDLINNNFKEELNTEEDLLVKLLFDESLSDDDREEILKDGKLEAEYFEYLEVLGSVEKSCIESRVDIELDEDQRRNLLLLAEEKENRFWFSKLGDFAKNHPYHSEFSFVLFSLCLFVLDYEVFEGSEIHSVSFLAISLLFFYLFVLKKRIRKEMGLLKQISRPSSSLIGLSSPLTLFTVTSIILFVILIITF